MSISERKERARQDLRMRIMATAEALFVQDGYENVSMRKIARQIEYSPTTIYHYFKNKEALFACLLESYHGRLFARMEEIYGQGDDPIVALKKGMRAYTEFGLANPSYYSLAFMSPPEFKAESYLVEGSKGTALFLRLRASVELCIRQGLFAQMDVGLAAQVLWTMNHGVTSLLITNPNFPWADRNALIDRVIDCAVDGLRARQGGQ
jgi:AcrR family transcriptional regulator